MSGARGGPGSVVEYQGEEWSGDPRVAPGLPRPIGWRVRQPDGSAAYDKATAPDTGWVPVGGAGGGSGVASVNGNVGPAVALTLASVFAFGLADVPATDNVFNGPGYNLHFPLGGTENAGVAIIEQPAHAADTRAAALSLQRYYAGGGIGELGFRSETAFNPTFNGFDLLFWDEFAFSSIQQISGVGTDTPWPSGIQLTKDWTLFNYPQHGAFSTWAYPPDGGGGPYVTKRTDLRYIDGSQQTVSAETSFGQWYGQIQPIVQPGHALPQLVTFNVAHPAGDSVGSGTGWLSVSGSLQNPGFYSGFLSHTIDELAVPNVSWPKWGWHFWANYDNSNDLVHALGINAAGINATVPLSVGGGAPLASLEVEAPGAQAVTLGATGPAALTSLVPSTWIVVTIAGQKVAIPAFATT